MPGAEVKALPGLNSKVRLDETDVKILELLQLKGRMKSSELARHVELSGAGFKKRLKKLEHKGIIAEYVARVDRQTVGLDLLCFIQVTLQNHHPETVADFRREVSRLVEVLECHHMTGEFDYLVKIVVRDHLHLEHFLFKDLTQVAGVDRIRTSLVLNEIKNSTALPLHLGRRDV